MAGVAVIGEEVRIQGFALAGAPSWLPRTPPLRARRGTHSAMTSLWQSSRLELLVLCATPPPVRG